MTMSMAFQPCHIPGRMAAVVYERHTTETGLTYKGWQMGAVLMSGVWSRGCDGVASDALLEPARRGFGTRR